MRTISVIIIISFILLVVAIGVRANASDETAEPLIFYRQIHNTSTQPICAQRATGLAAITNCIVYVIKQLKPLAAVLLVIAITISGALLVFSPLKPSEVESAKTIFIWACIGFVIVFSADLIRGVLHELAGVPIR